MGLWAMIEKRSHQGVDILCSFELFSAIYLEFGTKGLRLRCGVMRQTGKPTHVAFQVERVPKQRGSNGDRMPPPAHQ